MSLTYIIELGLALACVTMIYFIGPGDHVRRLGGFELAFVGCILIAVAFARHLGDAGGLMLASLFAASMPIRFYISREIAIRTGSYSMPAQWPLFAAFTCAVWGFVLQPGANFQWSTSVFDTPGFDPQIRRPEPTVWRTDSQDRPFLRDIHPASPISAAREQP